MATTTPLNGEAFLVVVQKSGLVDPQRLRALIDEFRSAGGAADNAKALAEFLVGKSAITKWQAEKLLLGKHRGYILGKYRLLSLIGKGGMSSVFLAEHTVMRRHCAIKVLPSKRVGDSSYLARFHREAEAVAALDHPNIVRAYDVDHQTNPDGSVNHFLIMEYVDGGSLQEIITQQGPAGFVDAADDIRQAAEGLAHAHQAGLVHRDIKPANLLRDQNGVIKILDLGLARFDNQGKDESLTIQHDEKVLGTADYLAPEQALDSHSVDARADIYSLGCTLYFMLTGHPPFTEGTLTQRLMAHQTKVPASVETDRPDTPPGLSQILQKMMAKKPSERFETAKETAEALRKWLSRNAPMEWKKAHAELFTNDHASRPTARVAQVVSPISSPSATAPAPLESSPRQTPGSLHSSLDAPAPVSPPTGAADSTKVTPRPKSQPTTPTKQPSPEPSNYTSASDASSENENREPVSAGPDFSFMSATSQESLAPAETESGSDLFDFSAPTTKAQPQRTTLTDSAPIPAIAASNEVSASASPKLSGTVRPADVDDSQSELQPESVEEADRGFDVLGNISGPIPVVHDTAATEPVSRPRSTPEPSGAFFNGAGTGVANRPWHNPRLQLIAGGVLALLLVAGAGYGMGWFGTGSKSDDKTSSRSTGTPPVKTTAGNVKASSEWSRKRIATVGPGGDFSTLTEALNVARQYFSPKVRSERFTIKVAAGTYPERIAIDGKTWPNNVVVVAEGGAVMLNPSGGDPVIRVTNVEGIQISGLMVNAADKAVGVELTGNLARVKLTQLHVKGFRDAAVALRGGMGLSFTDSNCVLDGCRFEGGGAHGVGVKAVPHDDADVQNVILQKCRFLGPLAAGASIQGKEATHIEFRECLFVETSIGVQLVGKTSWRDFQFVHNTFYKCQRGIVIGEQPEPSSKGLSIRRNLFVGATAGEVIIEHGDNEDVRLTNQMLGPMTGNWSDRAPPEMPVGELAIFGVASGGRQSVADIAFASTDLNDPQFLAPAQNAPQLNQDAQLPDEHPWIGAIGP